MAETVSGHDHSRHVACGPKITSCGLQITLVWPSYCNSGDPLWPINSGLWPRNYELWPTFYMQFLMLCASLTACGLKIPVVWPSYYIVWPKNYKRVAEILHGCGQDISPSEPNFVAGIGLPPYSRFA